MTLDDNVLIKKILKGERSAKQQLYDRNEVTWFRISLRYGSSREEAEDIFQEGVVRIFSVLENFKTDLGKFSSWSNRILVNEALKYLKKYKRLSPFEDIENSQQVADPTGNHIDVLSARELTELIQRLPDGYRTVFNLYEIEGYSHDEIADLLGISPGTSKSQLFKAKKTLQKQLEVLF